LSPGRNLNPDSHAPSATEQANERLRWSIPGWVKYYEALIIALQINGVRSVVIMSYEWLTSIGGQDTGLRSRSRSTGPPRWLELSPAASPQPGLSPARGCPITPAVGCLDGIGGDRLLAREKEFPEDDCKPW